MTAGARLSRSLALPLLAVVIAYLVVGYGAGRPAGKAGDPSYFIHAGQRFLAPDLLPRDSFVEQENGYDGQFFFTSRRTCSWTAEPPAEIRRNRTTWTTSRIATSASSSRSRAG
jgi:hypothetical protein